MKVYRGYNKDYPNWGTREGQNHIWTTDDLDYAIMYANEFDNGGVVEFEIDDSKVNYASEYDYEEILGDEFAADPIDADNETCQMMRDNGYNVLYFEAGDNSVFLILDNSLIKSAREIDTDTYFDDEINEVLKNAGVQINESPISDEDYDNLKIGDKVVYDDNNSKMVQPSKYDSIVDKDDDTITTQTRHHSGRARTNVKWNKDHFKRKFSLKESCLMTEKGEQIFYTKSESVMMRIIKNKFIDKPVRVYYDFTKNLYVFGNAFELIHVELLEKMLENTNIYPVKSWYEYGYNEDKGYWKSNFLTWRHLEPNCAMFQIIFDNDIQKYTRYDNYLDGYWTQYNNMIIICRREELKKCEKVPMLWNNHWNSNKYDPLKNIKLNEAGYSGYSKSNNAIEAESENKFPASIAAKKLGVSTEAIKNNIRTSEWHHYGSWYNEVYVYDITPYLMLKNGEDMSEYYDEDEIDEYKSIYKTMKEESKKKNIDEKKYKANVEYIEWTGTRQRPKANIKKYDNITVIEKGQFYTFMLPDGTSIRKKIDSNGTHVIPMSVVKQQEKQKKEQLKIAKENFKEFKKNTSRKALKFIKDNNLESNSNGSHYYIQGRKPSQWDYDDLSKFYKVGELRLSSKEDRLSTAGVYLEKWNGNQWIPIEDTSFDDSKNYNLYSMFYLNKFLKGV